MSPFCYPVVFRLSVSLRLEVVEPSSRIIHICEFRQVLIPITSHFKYWHHNRKVIGCTEILSSVIFQIPDVDSPIQVDIKCPQMRSWENAESPIGSGFLDTFRVVNARADFKVDGFMDTQMVCVQDKKVFFLVSCINKLEDLRTDEIIVSIDDCHNLSTVAQSPSRIVNVR